MTTTGRTSRNKHGLDVRVLVVTIAAVFSAVVIGGIVELGVVARIYTRDTISSIDALVGAMRLPASEAAFDFDHDYARTVVQGLANHPFVLGAILTDDRNQMLVEGYTREPEMPIQSVVGVAIPEAINVRLVYNDIHVGQLRVFVDTSRIRDLAVNIATRSAMTGILVGVVASILLAIFYSRLFVRPITQLEALLDAVAPGKAFTLPQELAKRKDEIGSLGRGLEQALMELHNALLREETASNELRAALEHQKVLTREIHHRVKNNLQVVNSLMTLQLSRVSDPAAGKALSESRARVHAMALVHEQLYGSGSVSQLEVGEYLRELTHRTVEGHAAMRNIDVQFRIDRSQRDLNGAILLGLIVNELIINALEHGCADRNDCGLTVRLQVIDDDWEEVEVADDGPGLEADYSPTHSTGLGHQLVASLCEQLGGSYSMTSDDGLHVTLKLPRYIVPDR